MTLIFLTDGVDHWIGPYQSGDFAINRAKRDLIENFGASDVHAVRAPDLESAKTVWQRSQSK